MSRGRAIALVALAGCAAHRPPAPPPAPLPESPAGVDRAQIARELDTLLDAADRMCACADEPCLAAVDADLTAYSRVATMNDPITDLETWPSDLDAMGRAAAVRILVCALERDHTPGWIGVMQLRRQRSLRDAACACEDASCAAKARDARARIRKEQGPAWLMDDASTAAYQAAGAELDACIARPLAEQALIELRAIRTDACACADAACADAQQQVLARWTQDNARTPTSAQDTADEFRQVAQDIAACFAAARGQ